jgi:hypothetical protein
VLDWHIRVSGRFVSSRTAKGKVGYEMRQRLEDNANPGPAGIPPVRTGATCARDPTGLDGTAEPAWSPPREALAVSPNRVYGGVWPTPSPEAPMDSLPLAARVAARAPRTRSRERVTPEPLPKPEMNRQERVIFTVYVVMAVLITAFLVAVGVALSLG